MDIGFRCSWLSQKNLNWPWRWKLQPRPAGPWGIGPYVSEKRQPSLRRPSRPALRPHCRPSLLSRTPFQLADFLTFDLTAQQLIPGTRRIVLLTFKPLTSFCAPFPSVVLALRLDSQGIGCRDEALGAPALLADLPVRLADSQCLGRQPHSAHFHLPLGKCLSPRLQPDRASSICLLARAMMD